MAPSSGWFAPTTVRLDKLLLERRDAGLKRNERAHHRRVALGRPRVRGSRLLS